MAKILVADDNSNIQKMVGLALKDQGIDVIAVGNGEAAVRKISELHPDLVLADVFMPVRNGYEVCEYVKSDTSLTHIPVILLVGAFDPLDEQEAQRVGADGVLKKPFVPPEPLISMVKSALARAVATAAAAPPPAAPAPAPAAAEMPVPAAAPEELPDIFSLQPASVTVPEGSEALAFGNLLDTETPAQAAPAAEEHAWGNAPAANAVTEEVAEEAAPELSWQSRSPEETVDGLPPAGAKDWRDSDLAAVPETSHGEQAMTEEHAESASAYAATGIEEEASPVPEVSSHAWTETAPAAEEALTPPWERSAPASSPSFFEEPAPATEIAAPANAWDTEAQKAGQLAATWNSAQAETPAAEAEIETEAAAESEEPAAQHDFYAPAASSEELLLPRQEEQPVAFSEEAPAQEIFYGAPATEEEPVSAATEEAQVAPVEPEPAVMEFAASPALSKLVSEAVPSMPDRADAAAASAPDMDAMVAKVLEKMSPEVIQAVTRELVKPMIEAILRGELDKKK